MNRYHAAVFLAVLFIPVFALARPWYPSRTGEHLVQDYIGHPDLKDSPHRLNIIFKEGAKGYLSAIKDITQGVKWCYDGVSKPHEIDHHVIVGLQKLPAAELKAEAGPLVLAQLSREFPCKANSERAK